MIFQNKMRFLKDIKEYNSTFWHTLFSSFVRYYYTNPYLMRITVPLLLVLVGNLHAVAQNSVDTGALIEQKEKIITAATILKIENLGININSDLPELRPTISADGNLLFFICENHPANTKYNSVPNSQDIWYSIRDSAGHWAEARHLKYPLNTVQYNAVYWISPEQQIVRLAK